MAFGIDDAVAAVGSIIGKVIDRAWPDPAQKAAAQLELLKMQQTGELARLTSETDLMKGQLEINKAEATSSSVFVAGWRPFVGWVGGAALAYATILEPLLRFIAGVAFGYHGMFPVIDTSLTLQILGAILGLGVMRSYDKKQGTA